jgi:cobalt-zinc-cadmium efflux system protein
LFGFALNVLLVISQIFFGFQSNSVALLSDAFHNAGDALALLIAWGGFYISKLQTSEKFTFGFKNTTIIAALINAVFLFVAVGGISWEAIQRIQAPEMVNSTTVLIVAAIAVILNIMTAMLFISGKKDINLRAAVLHAISDAAVSMGVIVASIIIMKTHWYWVDPVVSILISIAIIFSSWRLFKEAINLILHAVPEHIEVEKVRAFLLNQKEVKEVHDLHIWAISTVETALSAHIIIENIDSQANVLKNIHKELESKFHIKHTTIQIENKTWQDVCEVAC